MASLTKIVSTVSTVRIPSAFRSPKCAISRPGNHYNRHGRFLLRAEKEVSASVVDPMAGINSEDGVRCYVNEDGHLVCERLEPGDYVVKSTPKMEHDDMNATIKSATYCYITDDGELICEGLESGEYTIERASDDDVEAMLKHVEGLAAEEAAAAEIEEDSTDNGRVAQKEQPAAAGGGAAATEDYIDPETGVRCYVNSDGHLVCERLDPGDYVVKTAATMEHGSAISNAPRCDINNPSSCVTYCYITDDGEMVCEGLPEGQYTIERATDDDIEGMLEHLKSMDGA